MSNADRQADLSLQAALERLLAQDTAPSLGTGSPKPPGPAHELDDFRLIRLLGRGGMGEVWEGEQRSLERRVALKLLPPRLARVQRERARFAREAQAGGRLNHPNIVAVYAIGESQGCHYIVQELVQDGATLADFIAEMREEAEFPRDYDRRVAELISKSARALQAAHDAGVIHRDIKPQNILVTPDDEPKVADFGLARLTDTEAISRTGEFAGTYFYMSPEQAMSQRMGIDHRTDIFSLGATLYELITLRRAFEGETTHEVAEKILYADPVDPREVRESIPIDLAVICSKAIAKRREHRYTSMTAFADDLDRFLRNEPIHARPPSPWLRAQKWARRHPSATAASLAALLAIAALVPFLLGNRQTLAATEVDLALTRAQLLAEQGDLEGAEREVATVLEQDAENITGHLLLAMSYAGRGSFRSVERHLAAVRDFLPEHSESAEDHYALGLYRIAERDPAKSEAALDHIELAYELDPSLPGIHYALYQARVAAGDAPGAIAALNEYSLRIPQGDALYAVVNALRLELQGEHSEALATLGQLTPAPSLNVNRIKGRLRLQLKQWEDARSDLENAVAEVPDDCASWCYLAVCLVELQRAEPGASFERLDQAEQHAKRALTCSPHVEQARYVLAHVATERFALETPVVQPRSTDSWRAADTLVGALDLTQTLEPQRKEALRARLLHAEAGSLSAAGQRDAAWGRYRESLELSPHDLDVRAEFAQKSFFAGDYAQALEQFELALESTRDPAFDVQPRWQFSIEVWIFGTAPYVGDLERARRARESAEETLRRHPDQRTHDLLNLAEFLATPPLESLKDCKRAAAIVAEFKLASVYAGRAEAEAILRLIDTACP